MIERDGTSGVVVVSSMMGYMSMPACSVYAASKAYLNNFVLAVEHELTAFKHKVDMLLYTPGFVSTQMIVDVKNKSMVPAQTESVQKTVSCALRDLGYK